LYSSDFIDLESWAVLSPPPNHLDQKAMLHSLSAKTRTD
jgi:hypothetical protein